MLASWAKRVELRVEVDDRANIPVFGRSEISSENVYGGDVASGGTAKARGAVAENPKISCLIALNIVSRSLRELSIDAYASSSAVSLPPSDGPPPAASMKLDGTGSLPVPDDGTTAAWIEHLLVATMICIAVIVRACVLGIRAADLLHHDDLSVRTIAHACNNSRHTYESVAPPFDPGRFEMPTFDYTKEMGMAVPVAPVLVNLRKRVTRPGA
ncbi:uncharacterized protein B0H18DRAFT_955391 [Fomitopsis serialis]|uniref:uncharacterized protein n=1 Tax=Fomitopsis serialis TaxID=139415 RepID=UPI0020086DF1|nr:uncharacterized protein B0H18DRAFT_955391 [Neoantrodia serialis]KAH9924799.1 hypothetical protein B0H18DRAFT_955391 [Neoantrodia serialis]